MLYFQRLHIANPERTFVRRKGFPRRLHRRSAAHFMYCGAAFITRLAAKLLAVISALWILAWSLMSYSNIMHTPYCATAYLGLRENGWMRLWNYDPQQFVHTKVNELRSLIFGSVVAHVACMILFLATSKASWRYAIATCVTAGFLTVIILLGIYGRNSLANVTL
jgi:hypothetical protein